MAHDTKYRWYDKAKQDVESVLGPEWAKPRNMVYIYACLAAAYEGIEHMKEELKLRDLVDARVDGIVSKMLAGLAR